MLQEATLNKGDTTLSSGGQFLPAVSVSGNGPSGDFLKRCVHAGGKCCCCVDAKGIQHSYSDRHCKCRFTLPFQCLCSLVHISLLLRGIPVACVNVALIFFAVFYLRFIGFPDGYCTAGNVRL